MGHGAAELDAPATAEHARGGVELAAERRHAERFEAASEAHEPLRSRSWGRCRGGRPELGGDRWWDRLDDRWPDGDRWFGWRRDIEGGLVVSSGAGSSTATGATVRSARLGSTTIAVTKATASDLIAREHSLYL